MAIPARFTIPAIQDNPSGWGPCTIPDQYKDMPYQPFSKGDRLGKVSDWTGATYQDRRYASKYTSTFGSMQQYAYYHEEDESTFQHVYKTNIPKPLYQRGRYMRNQRNLKNQRNNKNQNQLQVLTKGQKRETKWQKNQFQRRWNQRGQPAIKNRDASVTVRPEWKVMEEMDFPRLAKLSLPNIDDPKDLYCCGSMEYYDKAYDRVTVKNDKKLQRINRIFHKVTTTDDPIVRQLTKTEGNVYATDAILSTIMCCSRSNYSWDVVVQKIAGKLFFDKRDDSEFDLLTVNETSSEPPQEEGNSLNSPRNLSLEATFINHNFSQQVLKSDGDRYKFEHENPFLDEDEKDEVAPVGYRYRKWSLGNDVQLVARTEHDAVQLGPNNELQFINLKALNEWDSRFSGGVEWRQKLDTQRGAVLANELKNNACKLAKWTVQAILAGSDQIKFGYVSRQNVRDSTKHMILGTQQFKPQEFANQINLSMDNAWGILRCIIDICMKLPDGKYLIMKDPNKGMIRLYDIPDNTFESDDEDVPEKQTEEGTT
ncbi:UNVERIFIED_CONTAM: hypothetical protein RMT77_002923 [Armadillidium vulgare]